MLWCQWKVRNVLYLTPEMEKTRQEHEMVFTSLLNSLIFVTGPTPLEFLQLNKGLNHWKSPYCWERLRARGERGDRGRDGWLLSLTRWTWVWTNSKREWRTWKAGVLQSVGSQRVRHDLVTEQQQQQRFKWSEYKLYSYHWKIILILFTIILALLCMYEHRTQALAYLSLLFLHPPAEIPLYSSQI